MVKKAGSALSWILPVLLMVALGLGLSVILHQLDVGAEERDQQQVEIAALQAGLDEANARLEARGEQPVAVPKAEAKPTAPQVILGKDGRDGIDGEDGQDGKPGKDGRDGEDGTDGGPGTDGLNGADGVPGTAGTNGVDGKDGADGAPGKDGRGIADIVCHTTGDWIITLTDGTAITVKGPCRVTQPSPTPTPTPSTMKGR